MRDQYDLKLIFHNGFFNTLKYKSFFQVITNENYETLKLTKKEIKEISAKLKLSKSRVIINHKIDYKMFLTSKVCAIG